MGWIGKAGGTSGRHFRAAFFAGLLIIIPVLVTTLVIVFILNFFENILKDPLDRAVPGGYRPGMGIATLLVGTYLVGLVATFVLGRRLLDMGHAVVDMIPLVSGVYRTARQAMNVLSTVTSHTDDSYSSVVLVEFPGYGLRSIGLVTSKLEDQNGQPLLAVYMPTSPFPTSGFLVFMSPDLVTPTNISVDDAMKLVVSAGIMAPDKIETGPITGPIWVPSAPEEVYRGVDAVDNPEEGESEASNQ